MLTRYPIRLDADPHSALDEGSHGLSIIDCYRTRRGNDLPGSELPVVAAIQSIALDEHEIIEMMESPDTESSR